MSDRGSRSLSLTFVAGDHRPDEVRLLGLRGRERVSLPFAFDLYLARDAGSFSNDEIDALFKVPIAIAMGPDPGDVVRGVLESIRELEASGRGAALYLARLVPTVSLLRLSKTNRIFQNLTVPEIVASVLAEYQLQPERDYRILARATSPRREYVVQYEESDWDFLSRWLEHEGFYTWFEHGGANDLLVISDGREAAPPIGAPTAIRYRSGSFLENGDEASVSGWEIEQRRVPARLAVFDYNYRSPRTRLFAKASADENGFGTVMRYGEHFKTVDEGKAIATVRAERLKCESRVFSGQTDCSRFRVGHWFELLDANRTEDSRRYLITELDHEAGEMPGQDERRYASKFQAIPLDVQFRPEQVTAWPSIHGIMHGHVTGDAPGLYAEIDELGRYKVRFPFDSGKAKGASASRWIRMAQIQSGAGYGSHQPLHKGTEVLVSFIDGDPDRPIIVASVPNALTVSPSTGQNATQSVIRTASGIHLEMEDLANAGSTALGRKR